MLVKTLNKSLKVQKCEMKPLPEFWSTKNPKTLRKKPQTKLEKVVIFFQHLPEKCAIEIETLSLFKSYSKFKTPWKKL